MYDHKGTFAMKDTVPFTVGPQCPHFLKSASIHPVNLNPSMSA